MSHLYFKEIPDLSKIYSVVKNDDFSVSIMEVEKPSGLAKMMNPEYSGQKEQSVVILKDIRKNEVVMSDSWMEQHTNINFIRNANGHVLIAGLGLGMILLAIQDKPEVESITVVEINQSVIDLVLPILQKHLNGKITVICSDIHTFIPEKKFDVIYCDIWNDISGDNWDEMILLTKKFKYEVNRSNKDSFLDHWRKSDTKRMAYESYY